jgi:hypothetical protein
MSNPELYKLLAEEAAKVAVMTPEERSAYYDQIKAGQLAYMKANPYTEGDRQARAMRPKPTLKDALELPEIKALVEDAFSEGFAEGRDGGWIGGDYTYAWKHSNAFTALQTEGGA